MPGLCLTGVDDELEDALVVHEASAGLGDGAAAAAVAGGGVAEGVHPGHRPLQLLAALRARPTVSSGRAAGVPHGVPPGGVGNAPGSCRSR